MSPKMDMCYNDIMKLSLCKNCKSVLITSKNISGDRTVEFLSSKDRRAIVIKKNMKKKNIYISSIDNINGCLKCGNYKIDIF